MSMTPQITHFTGGDGNRLVADFFPAPNLERERGIAILLHGGGQTRHSWQATAMHLAANDISSYTIDARGHGESEWPENKGYTFWHYAQDVTEICQAIKARHGRAPISIGASMGGLASMLAIQLHGEALFEELVLVDITPRMDSRGVMKILGFMSEAMDDGFAEIEEAAEAIAAYLPNRARPKSLSGLRKNLRQGKDGRWRWHWDPAFINGENNISKRAFELESALNEGMSKATLPVLLVRGAQSELVSQAHVEEFLALVPHAEFVDVSDAGHMVAGDRNDKFTSAVVAFLNRQHG